MSSYKCLDNPDHVIRGIYDDQIFSYYEFSVSSKDDTQENLDNIDEYLFNNDCKLQIHYTDITVDLSNYEKPFNYFLNTFFIQLNPTLFIKRNIYFMNQYLSDDDWLFGVLNNDKKNIQMKTLFSRYEEYYLYLGMNRSQTKPLYYLDYIKLYLRADIRKTEIKRTYQKIMEFYANATSLLIGIYRLLNFIFNYINGFYAENSITRRIFFLKEFESLNNIDIYKKSKQIKELISLTESYSSDDSEINSFETNLKDLNDDKKIFNNYDLKTFTRHNKRQIDNNIKRNSFYLTEQYNKRINEKKGRNTWNSSILNDQEEFKDNSEQLRIKNIKMPDLQSKEENNKNNEMKMEYSFNIFEIIFNYICKCCMSKKLTLKFNINNKAKNFLYNKLDIISYIKNMILIDIINQSLLDENKNQIINFLCRPILSINKTEEYSFSQFYQNYRENDFDKLYEGVYQLIQKQNKDEKENKLIFLINKNLKDLV